MSLRPNESSVLKRNRKTISFSVLDEARYSPPHHLGGVIHETKDDAEIDDEEFDGQTSE